MPRNLNRRTILRGLGGAALALPFLELMTGKRALAAGPPKRFVFIYGGMSTVAGSTSTPKDLVTPSQVGKNYDLKRALEVLGTGTLTNQKLGQTGFGVQDYVSVVSGLKIPWATDGGSVPLGGRSKEFHYNTQGPQMSGMRGTKERREAPTGPTADQIVAAQLAGDTPHPFLSLRVQAASYVGANNTGGASGNISWQDDGDGGVKAVSAIQSPRLLYTNLFGNFAPPDDSQSGAKTARLNRHRSAVDLVSHRTEQLLPRLGSADRARLEKHYEGIRALEKRLATIPTGVGGACSAPDDPGEDPEVGGAFQEYNGQGGGGSGYSKEEERATAMFDMIHHAFACDLSRVAAVRMTRTQCAMVVKEMLGHDGTPHGFGHWGPSPQPNSLADCVGWHVKHMARLISKLAQTEEADGSKMIDHTALVLLFEGGVGYDPEGKPDHAVTHSTENMHAIIGGRAGGLNAGGGRHVKATNKHPAQVVLSAMNAVGVAEDTGKLGEVSGKIEELFG